jgi:serine/threonine-protein kinase
MIGTTVKQYKILERIGAGGMGVVYKAEDTRLGRIVALKFLPPYALDSEEDRARFMIEAQSAAALDHPNICTIHEIGDADQHQFIVMAYVSGPSLKERLKDGALDPAEAVNIASQVAAGLAKAHEKGIIHRDIKPANILLSDGGLVKVCDFGLAKSSISKKVTRTGSTIGTAAYMSPEQARSELVDQRTDIWSLGVILYEMLAGKPPFVADHEAVVIYSILNDDYPRLEEKRPGLPPELYAIVGKALAHKSNDRYASMDEMRRDLKSVAAKLTGPSAHSGGFPVVSPVTPPKDLAATIPPVRDTVITKVKPPKPAEKKPEPQSDEKKKSSPVLYIVVGALTVVAVLAIVWFNRQPSVEAPPEEVPVTVAPEIAPPEAAGDAVATSKSASSPVATEKLPVVAVLYMDNLNGNRQDDYFAAGITEDLIDELTNLKKIKVKSRFDVMPLRGQEFSVADMGKRLGADYLIEGAVRQEKKQLHLTAHLHRVSDQELVWSLRYDRPATDVFAVQAEIADSIARALAIAVTPEEKSVIAKAPTTNAEAYDNYLRGRQLTSSGKPTDNESAEKLYRKAISGDKEFCAAQLGLAYTLLQSLEWTDRDPKLIAEAETLVQRAAQRDTSSAAYLAALGLLLEVKGDQAGAIRTHRRLIQLSSLDPDANYRLGVELAQMGQIEEAGKSLHKAREARPNHAGVYHWLAVIAACTGHPDEASRQMTTALELSPEAPHLMAASGMISFMRGDFAEADALYKRVMTLRPKTYRFKGQAGVNALYQGRTNDAVDLLKDACEKAGTWQSCLRLGQAYKTAGKSTQSERAYRDALADASAKLKIRPADLELEYSILYLRILLGEVKDAEGDFKRLATNTQRTLDPTVRYYYTAAIDAQLGQSDRAIENVERVIKMNVLSPVNLGADPAFESLKKDARFKALVSAPAS